MKHLGKATSCALFIGLLSGCANGIGTTTNEDNTALSNQKVMDLTMQGIEPAVGQHYEGWVVGSNGVFSTGRFNVTAENEVLAVDSDGNSLGSLGNTSSSEHAYSNTAGRELSFILTIEPNGDTDTGPSSVHYVGGDFNGNTTNAITSHSGAIGASFETSEFSYILATPTNSAETNNQGIWFLDPTAGPAPSLSLPSLNSGWAYEGWIVDHSTGIVISTGVITSVRTADSDGAGLAAGLLAAPPFPGQDYIDPALILNDGNKSVVISVEPLPDFDPAPFTLKVLAHDIANGAPVATPIDGDNITNERDISISVVLK